jgi:uncharacterized membrane protein YdjX (TVP38/TMEM64 family)
MNSLIYRLKPYLRLVCCLLFFLFLSIILEVSGLRAEFTLTKIQLLFEKNIFIASLIFICAFSIGSMAGVPGGVFLGAAVYALGKTNGYLVTLTAGLISVSVSFFIVRLIGQDGLRKFEHPFALKLLSKLDDNPLKINITLRFLFQTLPPLNYTLALSGVKFKDYFMGALIGLPIPILIITLLIDQLIRFIS